MISEERSTSTHGRVLDEAERACEQSPWDIRIYPRSSSLFEIDGHGTAAGRAFRIRGETIRLHGDCAGEDALMPAIRRLENRLAALADEFHAVLPFPHWTRGTLEGMSAVEKVERARSEYRGARLRAVQLGPVDWIHYLQQQGLHLGTPEHARADGVAVRPGWDFRYVIAPA